MRSQMSVARRRLAVSDGRAAGLAPRADRPADAAMHVAGASDKRVTWVDPKDPAERYDQKFGVTQEYIFIHNDSLGGFTINGHGFPATTPIVAKLGASTR